MNIISFVLAVIALVILKTDISRRSNAEKEDGIERKSLTLLGIFIGIAAGFTIELALWRVIDVSINCIGICMVIGALSGSRINTSAGADNLIRYKKRKKQGIGILIIALVSCFIIFFAKILPFKDFISSGNLPESVFVYSEQNYYAYQSGDDCSGYSAAYVLRNEGIEANGEDIYADMDKFFGKAAVHNIIDELKKYGITAKSYYGNIDTLKSRINDGKPVIALVTITLGMHKGLHYLVVVGYDSEYIYVADSTAPKTNIHDKQQYNRKITYAEFEELWKTDIYPVNNIYIVID